MEELLERVLQQLGKSRAEFDDEVAELQKNNKVTALENQNAELNLQVVELWETIIDAGVI